MTIAAPLTPWACETAGPVRPMTGSAVPNSTREPGRVCRVATVGPLDGGPTVTQLRVLDLFSGIGGFSLGLERTGGFKTVQFCEIDAFCRRVLAKHWPDVPCHDDVTTMQFHEGMADVVTGGFPCQDISFAGKGAGLAGERSGLYRHLVDAIRVVRPRYAILENVAALLSRGLGYVLGDLAAIGYDAECHCIPASAVGAPHRRDRIWIVSHAHGERKPQSQGAVAIQRGRLGYLRQAQPHPHAAPLQWPAFLGHEQDRDHAGAGEVADAFGWGRSEDVQHVENSPTGGEEAGQPTRCGAAGNGQWRAEPDLCGSSNGFPLWLERCVGQGLSYAESNRRAEVLRRLWNDHAAAALWRAAGGLERLAQAEVLFAFVRQYEGGSNQARLLLAGAEASEDLLRSLRVEGLARSTSCQPKARGQSAGERADALLDVSPLLARDSEAYWKAHSWEDALPRVAKGVPQRVDRLRSLGNSIVPQIAEMIGHALLSAEHREAA